MIGLISDQTDFFRLFNQNVTEELCVWYIIKHTKFLCVRTVVYAIYVALWFLNEVYCGEGFFLLVYCFN